MDGLWQTQGELFRISGAIQFAGGVEVSPGVITQPFYRGRIERISDGELFDGSAVFLIPVMPSGGRNIIVFREEDVDTCVFQNGG